MHSFAVGASVVVGIMVGYDVSVGLAVGDGVGQVPHVTGHASYALTPSLFVVEQRNSVLVATQLLQSLSALPRWCQSGSSVHSYAVGAAVVVGIMVGCGESVGLAVGDGVGQVPHVTGHASYALTP